MKGTEVIPGEDSHGDCREQSGKHHLRAVDTRSPGAMAEGKRDGARDQQGADEPHLVEPTAVVGGCRLLIEVHAVRQGPDDQSGDDQQQLTGTSEAAEDEGPERGADQENVTEGIGEVREDRRRISVREPDQGGRQQGGGEGRRSEPPDRPVQPVGCGEVTNALLDQERNPHVEARQSGEVAGIGERRVRDPLGLRKRERPVEVASSPAQEAEANRSPRGSLVAHHCGAHEAGEARQHESGVIAPELRDVGELSRLSGGDVRGVGGPRI